ncbi:MAG: protein phosphatase 2C domain-containing protein [Bdellovibrionales bacterium]|nr:protein phosphatase 2C domain-containing protein [Bdellovibrionales bacterium]
MTHLEVEVPMFTESEAALSRVARDVAEDFSILRIERQCFSLTEIIPDSEIAEVAQEIRRILSLDPDTISSDAALLEMRNANAIGDKLDHLMERYRASLEQKYRELIGSNLEFLVRADVVTESFKSEIESGFLGEQQVFSLPVLATLVANKLSPEIVKRVFELYALAQSGAWEVSETLRGVVGTSGSLGAFEGERVYCALNSLVDQVGNDTKGAKFSYHLRRAFAVLSSDLRSTQLADKYFRALECRSVVCGREPRERVDDSRLQMQTVEINGGTYAFNFGSRAQGLIDTPSLHGGFGVERSESRFASIGKRIGEDTLYFSSDRNLVMIGDGASSTPGSDLLGALIEVYFRRSLEGSEDINLGDLIKGASHFASISLSMLRRVGTRAREQGASMQEVAFEAERPLVNLFIPWYQAHPEFHDLGFGEIFTALKDMSSTLCAVQILDSKIDCFHSGDSRIAVFVNQDLKYNAVPHTLAEVRRSGNANGTAVSIDEAAENTLTNRVGLSDFSPYGGSPEFREVEFSASDRVRVLLCSDGPLKHLSWAEVCRIAKDASDPREAVNEILTICRDAGTWDDVALVILDRKL